RATATCRFAVDRRSQGRLIVEHDLFRKPVPTPDQARGMLFRDHALAPLLCVGFELLLERSELGEGRVGVGSLVAALLRRAGGKKASFAGRARRPIAAVGPRLARRTLLPRRTFGSRPLDGSRGRRRGDSSGRALRLGRRLLLGATRRATR